MKLTGEVNPAEAELLAAIADLLRDELSRVHVQDIATSLGRTQPVKQEISRKVQEDLPVLPNAQFRDRIRDALDQVRQQRHWSDERLARELGRKKRTLTNWTDGTVEDVPFAAISRLSTLSGYPIGWFNGDLTDDDAEAARVSVGAAKDIASVISGAIEKSERAAERRHREAMAILRSLAPLSDVDLDRLPRRGIGEQ